MTNKVKNKKIEANFFKKLWVFISRYRFFWKRLGFALVSLFFAMILTFLILNLIPNDSIDEYAYYLMNTRLISHEEAYAEAIRILGYDPNENVFIKLFNYIGNLFQGNLGSSIRLPNLSANQVIAQFLPYTLFISSVALIISFFIGIKMGTSMASNKSKAKEVANTSFIVVSSSVPDYIWAILLLYIFGVVLKWFPKEGARDISNGLPAFIDFCWHSVLPIVSMVIVQISSWALNMRGSCVSVLGEDYVNAAYARGIPKRLVNSRYLTRNALLPLVTSIAISFAALFGGSTLIESMFNFPGLGLQLSYYIGQRDYFIVVGILFFTSSIIIIANLIADSVYSLIDPRIRRDS